MLERARARFAREPEVLGLIVGGSVGRGLARPDSDLDVMIVVSDAEAERRRAGRNHLVVDLDLSDYDDGYLDGKIVTLELIEDVARRGSEPARWAFAGAFVADSAIDGLEEAVRAAGAYPEHERDEKLRDFAAHVRMMEWFAREAEKRADRYLLSFASSHLALYAGRTILALNRMLYPYHKWFLTELARAPERPPDLLERIDALLASPAVEAAAALARSVLEFAGLELEVEEAATRFLERSEWNWRYGPPPLEDS